ncbi:hypothetical protein GCM10018966_061660 [Streptomyces yanii]
MLKPLEVPAAEGVKASVCIDVRLEGRADRAVLVAEFPAVRADDDEPAATKLGRGELFETIGFLNYLRETVLGPLAARRVDAMPRGVRHLETVAPEEAHDLQATLCGYDRNEAGQALLAAVDLYRRWSDAGGAVVERRHHAEKLTLQYLHDVSDQGH